jgi:hypothetical protein
VLLNASTLALLGTSLAAAGLGIAAAVFAVRLLRQWDPSSGSERQLRLESQTYLVATMVSVALALQVLALPLFALTAESLSGQLVGAMCATGVLNASGWGFLALGMKILVLFVAVAWLVLNRADNQGEDYPLIRWKYALLLLLGPLLVAESLVLGAHLSGLRPDVITSCCGTLFSADDGSIRNELSALGPLPALLGFYGLGIALLAAGALQLFAGRGARAYAGLGMAAWVGGILATVSFISLYVYEHPNHQCPFCLLKPEYGYFGYFLYLPLFGGAALALGAGILDQAARAPSIARSASRDARRFTGASLLCFLVFYAVATWPVLHSPLRLLGVPG